ncbi:AT-rich interactive domain-containing protein 4A [Clonorchis sinensis]|uniref:AT-rich interactive domain-containing protein 4A n=1 Tax=Clonorchis sinensis TaxID=79923 RepID=H2KT49_CLOSI|nr:AT-rich interactive domain-containing protein 4A [Clonorchis sinensis]
MTDTNTAGALLLSESTTDDASKNCGPVIFLTNGTAVSAKYRGAYCEATVDDVLLRFRLRVQLKGAKGVVSVDENALVSGEPTPGSEVMVRIPSTDNRLSNPLPTVERVGTVLRVVDTSLYTVVFDDGDKRTLRRTQLVLKGERHFKESESLDSLPLTNPEQFRQPVIDRKKHRSNEDDANEEDEDECSSEEQDDDERKRKAISKMSETSGCPILDTKSPSVLSEDHCPGASMGSAPELHPEADSSLLNESHVASQSLATEERSSNKPECRLSVPYQRLIGRLVLVNMPLSHKDTIPSPSSSIGNISVSSSEALARRRFTPALVVLPSAMPSIDLRLPGSGKLAKVPNLLVRSFKDNRFFPVPLCYLKRLKRPSAVELAHSHPSLRNAFERALLWLDRYELPAPWGETAMQTLLEREEESSSSSSPSDSDSSSSVDFEARDRWIAQLYRFMDEGGAPINKAPSLANKDLDLYKLYKLVRAHGGFHRVTAQLKWGYIYSKLGLPHNFAAGPRNLQAAFKRYLYPLDDISRKLGTDLDELPLARPRHLSSNSGSAMRSFIGSARAVTISTPKPSTTEAKTSDSKGNAAKAVPHTAKEAVVSTPEVPAPEQTSEPAVECSPPVLSPPVLGRTPSPPADHWISSALDTTATPLRSVRKQIASLQSTKEQPGKTLDVSAARANRKTKEVKHTPAVTTQDKAVKTTVDATSEPQVVTPLSTSSSSADSCNNNSQSERTKHDLPHQPLFLQLPDDLSRFNDNCEMSKLNQIIPIGSRVRVRCGDRVAYEAKVLKHIRPQPGLVARGGNESNLPASWTCPTETQYRVHYMGWNTRHDEVVSRSRIISIVEWARPPDSDRPPSCSSLNLVVQEPLRRSHAAVSGGSKSASRVAAQNQGRDKSGPDRDTKQKEKEDDQGSSEVEQEEEEVESDQSQTTETASDIVTTTAPMIRRRRMMFNKDDRLHKRSRLKSRISSSQVTLKRTLLPVASNVAELKRSTNKPNAVSKEASLQSAKLEQHPVTSKTSQRTTRPSLPPAPSSKRPRLASDTDEGDKEQQSARPASLDLKEPKSSRPKTNETKSVKPEEKSSVDDTTKESKSKAPDKYPANSRELVSKTIREGSRTKPDRIPAVHKRPSSLVRTKLGSLKGRLPIKRTPLTKAPAARVRDQSRSRSSSSDSNRSSSSNVSRSYPSGANSRTGGPKKIVGDKENTPQSDAAAKKKTIQGTPTVERKMSTTVKADEPEITTPRVQKTTVLDTRKLAKLITGGAKDKTPFKRKVDTGTPDNNNASKLVRKLATHKPAVTGTPQNEKHKLSSTKTLAKADGEKINATALKPQQRTLTKADSSSSDESEVSNKDGKNRENNTSIRRTSTISQRRCSSPSVKKRTTGSRLSQTKPRIIAESSASVSSNDEGKRKLTTSIEDSDVESSESDFGAMDALPRLTRSQHRQLLGDTPPGAALQTASPVVNTATTGVTTSTAIGSPATSSESHTKTSVPTTNSRISDLKTDMTEDNQFPEAEAALVTEVKEENVWAETVDSHEVLPSGTPVSSPVPSTSNEPLMETKHELKPEDEDTLVVLDKDNKPKRLAKLRPRTKTVNNEVTAESKDLTEAKNSVLSKSESTDKVDDDDERSSVHTMSTDPMKDLLFDFTMSPSEESTATSSAPSEEGVDVNQVKPSRKSMRSTQKELSDSNDEESSQPQNDEAEENSEEGGDLAKSLTVNSTGAMEVDSVVRASPNAKLRTRSERVRHISTSSSTADGTGRKAPGKRGSGTPLRATAFDRSPTPASESPHYSRSPIPSSGAPTSACGPGPSATKSAVGSAPPPSRLGSSRRFGGPFFPIAGFEEMSSETKCQLLQERMQRILEAWRSAKQYLKDLDQRTNRSRRVRAKQSVTEPPPAATAPQTSTRQFNAEEIQKQDESFSDVTVTEGAPERAAAVHFP